MSILTKLQDMADANQPLTLTRSEYQALCREVYELGNLAVNYDDLILNYIYQDKDVTIKDDE